MMLRKNGHIDYLINFLLMTNFCQFKGGGRGGYKQWFFSKTSFFTQIFKWYFFKIILKDLNNFATPWFYYKQIWVKLLMGTIIWITSQNFRKKTCTKSYRGKQKLQFLKNWTYILHNKNIFVKYLMKTLLNSHWIQSHIWILLMNLHNKRFVYFFLFITCYFKFFLEPFILHNYKL